MKKILILFLLISGVVSAQKSPNEAKIRAMVDNLKKYDFQPIVAEFDSSLKKSMDTTRLGKMWRGLVSNNGQLQSITGVDVAKQGAMEVNYAHIQLEKRKFDIRIIFNDNGTVRAFNFIPPVEARANYQIPSYAKPELMEEKSMEVLSGNYKLNGMLSLPKGKSKVPVVILVHGMGANDKDETFGPLKIFRDLSYGLTANGIGVFRYDKRTKQYGSKVLREKDFNLRAEILDDVLSAINTVKMDPSVDTNHIFLCGHSYGATMLPFLADEAKVAGYIFLAPDNRPVEDIMLANATDAMQSATNPRQKAQFDTMKAEIARVKLLKSDPTAFNDSVMLLRFPVRFWKDLRTYDPMLKAKSIRQPLLVMYGERDYQVVKSIYAEWKSTVSGKNFTYKSYPSLNHFFVDGKEKSTSEEYKKPGNFSLTAINDMANWVKGVK